MKPKALADGLAVSLEWDTDAVLADLRCPVTLITGDPALGAVMTAEEVNRATGIVRGSRALRVDGVGHLIHERQPRAWLDAVNGWIDSVLAGP